jgi:formylglycine-generating enzyme required for sulfatase activity
LSAQLIIREPLGERMLGDRALPVSIGGAGSDIVVPAPVAGPLAWIGEQDGQLFLQPVSGEAPVLHNGARIAGSTWLRGGDVLDVGGGRLRLSTEDGARLIEVVAGAADNATEPPVLPEVPLVSAEGDELPIEAVAFRQASAEARARTAPSWRRWRVAAPLGLLAVLAGYLFTSVPILLEVKPEGTSLNVEGGVWPPLGYGTNRLLRPGNYTLVAEHKGYETLRVPLPVTRDGKRQFSFNLEMLPGRLRIDLPVPGDVGIDGKPAGKAPGEFRLAAGPHKILIDTERHLDYSTEVRITGRDELQRLAPKLVPGWAVVSVTSEPAGAEALVGGKPSGVTPVKLELMGGNHRLELRRAGYKAWVSDILVKANEPMKIGPVRLGIPDGRLAVRSAPAGANVTIGGVYRGRTPLEIDVRPDIAQAVAIARDGYEPATRQVSVGSGARQVVEVSLKAILGEVIVRATPADAELFVDGRARGAARQTLSLPTTAHTIEIKKPGYVTHKATITPRAGLPQNIEVTLYEGVPAAAAAAPAPAGAAPAESGAPGSAAPAMVALVPTLRTRTGQELKLLPAATFTMGSPRREAGRRSNEAQRAVNLVRRFYMSTREVTNADFKQFRPDHRSGFAMHNTLELDRQPVVSVSWQDAAEFCNWLSAEAGLKPAYEKRGEQLVAVTPVTNGYRLPTEAEWEFVARSENGGGRLRKYPWGESLPVPAGAGNFADRRAQPVVPQVLVDYDDGYIVSAPVGSFAPNSLGFFDMGGNVAEWTHDVYTVQPAASTAANDPVATGEGGVYVIRGSSWKHSSVTELRLAFRDFGNGRRNDTGFRVARYAQ